MKRRFTRPGVTLIEVGIALFIVAVSVAFSLRLMAGLVSYAGKEGRTIDTVRATDLGQAALDRLRDRPFPPTSRIEPLAWDGRKVFQQEPAWELLVGPRFDDPDYSHYQVALRVSRFDALGNPVTVTASDFNHQARVDRLGRHGLLLVEVDVYRGPVHLFRSVSYKARHGYY